MKLPDTILFEASQTFSVPCEIVDKYINAPYHALRLILFLIRNSTASYKKEDIASALSINEDELTAAFEYWIKENVFCKNADKISLSRPSIKVSDIVQYTATEISDRINGDTAVRFLYDRAEGIISRPLNTTDAFTLLSIVDWIGLPPEVAAMMLQYCDETDKRSMRQIEKTAVDWAEKGITTFDRAEKYIAAEKERREKVRIVSSLIGTGDRRLGEEEKRVFYTWMNDYQFTEEIISAAYESMIKSIGGYKYQYMDKILKSWAEKGVKTLADVERLADDKAKKPVKTAKKRYESTASVDTQQSENMAWAIIKQTVEEDDSE